MANETKRIPGGHRLAPTTKDAAGVYDGEGPHRCTDCGMKVRTGYGALAHSLATDSHATPRADGRGWIVRVPPAVAP